MSDFATLRDFFEREAGARRRNTVVAVDRVDVGDEAGTRLFGRDLVTGEAVAPVVVDREAAASAGSFQQGDAVSLQEYGRDESGSEVVESVRMVKHQAAESLQVHRDVTCRIDPPQRREATGQAVQVATLVHQDRATEIGQVSDFFSAAHAALADARRGGRPGLVLRGVDRNGKPVGVSFFRPNDMTNRRLSRVDEAVQAFCDAPRLVIEGMGGHNASGQRILNEFLSIPETRWEVVPAHLYRLAPEHCEDALQSFRGDLSQSYRFNPGGPSAGFASSVVVIDSERNRVLEAMPQHSAAIPRTLPNLATAVQDPEMVLDDLDLDVQPDRSPGSVDTDAVAAGAGPVGADAAGKPKNTQAQEASSQPAAANVSAPQAEEAPTSGAETSESSDQADQIASASSVDPRREDLPVQGVDTGSEPATASANAGSEESAAALPNDVPVNAFVEWLTENHSRNAKTRGNRISAVKKAQRVADQNNDTLARMLVVDWDGNTEKILTDLGLPYPGDDKTGKQRTQVIDRRGHNLRCMKLYRAFLDDYYPAAVRAAQAGYTQPTPATADQAPEETPQQPDDATETLSNQSVATGTETSGPSADAETATTAGEGPSDNGTMDLEARLRNLGAGGGEAEHPAQQRASRGDQQVAVTAQSGGTRSGVSADTTAENQGDALDTPSAEVPDADASEEVIDVSAQLEELDENDVGSLEDLTPNPAPGQ